MQIQLWHYHTHILNFKLALCTNVSHPENGMIITRGEGPQPAGASVTFACDNFYTLNGSAIITCECDGQWNASFPTCYAGNTV